MKRDVDTASHRDLSAEHPLGCPGVVVQHVCHVLGLPACVARNVAGVDDLHVHQLVLVRPDDGGEATQQGSPVPGGHGTPRFEGSVGSLDRSVGLLDRGPRDVGDDLFGGGVDDVGHDYSTRYSGTVRERRRGGLRVSGASPIGMETRPLSEGWQRLRVKSRPRRLMWTWHELPDHSAFGLATLYVNLE